MAKLDLKTRHLSDSAFCTGFSSLSKQALDGITPRFGIGVMKII